MQHLPQSGHPYEEGPFYHWVCAFCDACVQQNVEMVSIAFIEQNTMALLKAMDDGRAHVAMSLQAAAEGWRQQHAHGAGGAPSSSAPSPMHLQHAAVDVPMSLSKACEALAAAGKFIDCIVKASSAAGPEFTHRAVRALQFGTAVPLLMRIASLVQEVLPHNLLHSHGGGCPYSAVTLPSAVGALADTAKGAATSLLRTRVGGRSLHYVHLGGDMMKACEGLVRHVGRGPDGGARQPLRAQANDELSKLSAGQAQWLAPILQTLAEFQYDDLVQGMGGPSCGGGGGAGGMPNAMAVPGGSAGGAHWGQVDAIPPRQYVAFLRGLVEGVARLVAANNRSHTVLLRRACDAFTAKIPPLCDQLETFFGGGVTDGRAPALPSNSRFASSGMHAPPAQGATVVGAADWLSGAHSAVNGVMPTVPPQGIGSPLRAVQGAREVSRHGIAGSGVGAQGIPPFPDVQALRASMQGVTEARPQCIVSFMQQCESALGPSGAGLASPTFDRAAFLSRFSSSAVVDAHTAALAPHAVPHVDCQALVQGATVFYEERANALSSALVEAQRHNAAVAEAVSAQREYARRLEQAISFLQRTAAGQRQSGVPMPMALIDRVTANEGEWCARKKLPQPVNDALHVSSSAPLAPNSGYPPQQQQQHAFAADGCGASGPAAFGGGGWGGAVPQQQQQAFPQGGGGQPFGAQDASPTYAWRS